METPISRREALILPLTAAGLAGVALGTADAGDPPEGERPQQDEQLHQVITLLNVTSRRLSQIKETRADPPEPERPQFRLLLGSISEHCAFIDGIATDLLGRLRA